MLNLTEKLRAGYVRRCHIIPMAREQSLADHHYRVWLITQELLKACGLYSLNSNFCLNTLQMALIHDLHEVKVGDLPTNGKIKIRGAITTLYTPDDVDGPDALNYVAYTVDPEYAELVKCDEHNFDGLSALFVKLADIMEFMDHLGIMGMGPRAVEVWLNTMSASFVVADLLANRARLTDEQTRAISNMLVGCCDSALSRGWNVKQEKVL